MITIEIKNPEAFTEEGSEVDIYCDTEGLQDLQRQLNFLAHGETHVHIASPSWAGDELGEVPFGTGNVIVHQATIVKIPEQRA
jgi:catechol-2,3-dioxygenase